MDFEAFFAGELDVVRADGRYRVFTDIKRHRGKFPHATRFIEDETQAVTVWCSNDYLGMGQNPAVIAAMHEALDRCGAGAGGTRNISGTNHYHVELERELADLHGKEGALLFTSGYVSNWAALSTLGSRIPNAVIFSDAGNHASMIEGVRHSRADKVIWGHNDWRDLDRKLAAVGDRPKIVAFESVYSMDGDIAPIKEIVQVAKAHGALTYIDEVHAGTVITIRTRVVMGEGKKMHLFHEMSDGERLLATGEHFLLHVSLESRKPTPPAAHIEAALVRFAQGHAGLPLPDGIGRAIGAPR